MLPGQCHRAWLVCSCRTLHWLRLSGSAAGSRLSTTCCCGGHSGICRRRRRRPEFFGFYPELLRWIIPTFLLSSISGRMPPKLQNDPESKNLHGGGDSRQALEARPKLKTERKNPRPMHSLMVKTLRDETESNESNHWFPRLCAV